jgi:5-methylcytosine-specific restriction endonuclease McrA
MVELDFKTFGIRPNNRKLLQRIYEALSGLYAFGDFELRSAWLYYGSVSAASRTLIIPASAYRRLVKPQRILPMNIILMTDNLMYRWKTIRKFMNQGDRWCFRKCVAFIKIPDSARHIITNGTQMIMELSDAERDALFSTQRPMLIYGENYIRKVEAWRKIQSKNPVARAEKLLEAYVLGWCFRKRVRTFFQSNGIQRPLKNALECRDEIENAASSSKICFAALDIFREYETYVEQWAETHKHIEIQRNLLNSMRYKEFLTDLEKRHGLICVACGGTEDLQLDHVNPVSLGGFSVLENLQLLCHSCNSKKGTSVKDYRPCL